jgi:prephenate dehydrogenase
MQAKGVQKVAIIGLGLIGGSIGRSLIEQNFSKRIVGFDINRASLKEAVRCRAIHCEAFELEDAVDDADLVVLATPVGQVAETVLSVCDRLKSGAVITDVGSTKSFITSVLAESLRKDVFFVGGHPMTGSEQAGIEWADQYLFENAVYILTPTENTPEQALRCVREMVECLGAHVVCLTPEEHDLIVACVSHLPHMLAVSLVNTVAQVSETHQNVLSFTAGGFRDTTRIASGNINMWLDIVRTNPKKIVHAISLFGELLHELKECIETGDLERIRDLMFMAKQTRERIPSNKKGFLTSIYEIVIMLQDKPGAISKVTALLGDAGINIKDIEVLRVREGYGGTLRLGFAAQSELEEAIQILNKEGYSVR